MTRSWKWLASGSVAALTALTLSALTASPALAVGPPRVSVPNSTLQKLSSQGKGKGQSKGKGQLQAVIAELHAAKALLEKADHDYEGHRAKAAHEISAAIHELSANHKKKPGTGKAQAKPQNPNGKKAAAGAKGKGSGKGKGKLKEPQAVSDAQLKEAQKLLANALTKMPASHPKAVENIKAAIAELTTALKIK